MEDIDMGRNQLLKFTLSDDVYFATPIFALLPPVHLVIFVKNKKSGLYILH